MEQKIVAGFLYAKLRRADQMGIQVAIHFSIPSYKILCEEADLVELLGILLDNALEASSSGQLIELVGKIDGGYVRIEVSNPAPKMTNEQMQKMFPLGMKQKLGIAQAIMENQDILIFDEPFNALDYKTYQDIKAIIQQLKAQGKTILLTSHHFADIEELSDEVYVIGERQLMPMSNRLKETFAQK